MRHNPGASISPQSDKSNFPPANAANERIDSLHNQRLWIAADHCVPDACGCHAMKRSNAAFATSGFCRNAK